MTTGIRHDSKESWRVFVYIPDLPIYRKHSPNVAFMGHAAFRSKAGSWCDLRPRRIFVIGEFFLLPIRAAAREPRPQNFSRVGVGSGRSPHAHAQPLVCVAGPYRRRLRQAKGRKTGQIFAKSFCFAQCQDTSASSGVLWGGGSRKRSVCYTNLPTSVPTKWGGGLPQGGVPMPGGQITGCFCGLQRETIVIF